MSEANEHDQVADETTPEAGVLTEELATDVAGEPAAETPPAADNLDEPTPSVSTTSSRKLRIDEITKVRYQKGHVEIHFNELRKEWKVKSPDPPHPDFTQAMVALGDVVLNVMELPKRDDAPAVRVYQVNVTHKGERAGYILFAERTLKHSRLAHGLQTPLMWTAHKDQRQTFTDDQMAAVNRLVTEAALYVNGKTAQGDLYKQQPAALDHSGDGALPEGELPEVDPETQRQAALDGLVSMLGKNPNPNSVARTDQYYRDSIARVGGWLADGIYPADVIREVAEQLERSFVDWRRLREDEGAAGRGEAFSRAQLKKVDTLEQKLADLVAQAREAEAAAIVEEDVDGEAELTEDEQTILRMVEAAAEPLTLWQIASGTGLVQDVVSAALDELAAPPALVRIVHDKADEPVRWAPAVREEVPADPEQPLPF